MAVFATIAYTDAATTILNFIRGGLLDRYPKLKLMSAESGGGCRNVTSAVPETNSAKRPQA